MMSRMSSTLRTALTIVSLLVLAALPAACQLPAATPAPPATPPPAEAAPEPTVPAPAEPTAEASPEASADVSAAIDRAAAYLETQTLPEGGVDSFASGAADPTGTALAVTALAAAGRTDRTTDMVAYLAEQAVAYTHQAGEEGAEFLFPSRAGLLLLAVAAAGEDPATFGGQDLLGQLQAAYDPETGTYATDAQEEFTSGAASDVNQAWALLGLAAAGAEVPAEAGQYLIGLQGEDGSWGGSDPDTTARAVVALVGGARRPGEEASRRHRVLSRYAARERRLAPSWDRSLNADTTGWVVQALLTAGSFRGGVGARRASPSRRSWPCRRRMAPSAPLPTPTRPPKRSWPWPGPVVAPARRARRVPPGRRQDRWRSSCSSTRRGPSCAWCLRRGMTGLDALLGTGLAVDVPIRRWAPWCAPSTGRAARRRLLWPGANTWAYWHWADGEWVYSRSALRSTSSSPARSRAGRGAMQCPGGMTVARSSPLPTRRE